MIAIKNECLKIMWAVDARYLGRRWFVARSLAQIT